MWFDASNLERNLYLTVQFLEMGVPLVLALEHDGRSAQPGHPVEPGASEPRAGLPRGASGSRYSGGGDRAQGAHTVGRRQTPPRRLRPGPGGLREAGRVPRSRLISKTRPTEPTAAGWRSSCSGRGPTPPPRPWRLPRYWTRPAISGSSSGTARGKQRTSTSPTPGSGMPIPWPSG